MPRAKGNSRSQNRRSRVRQATAVSSASQGGWWLGAGFRLDVRIYGPQRSGGGKAVFTAADGTPAGQVGLLRERGYTDAQIRQQFPGLLVDLAS